MCLHTHSRSLLPCLLVKLHPREQIRKKPRGHQGTKRSPGSWIKWTEIYPFGGHGSGALKEQQQRHSHCEKLGPFNRSSLSPSHRSVLLWLSLRLVHGHRWRSWPNALFPTEVTLVQRETTLASDPSGPGGARSIALVFLHTERQSEPSGCSRGCHRRVLAGAKQLCWGTKPSGGRCRGCWRKWGRQGGLQQPPHSPCAHHTGSS